MAFILAHTVGLPARVAAALSTVPGIHAVYIYGSWAARRSGEIGSPPSDIDLLVVGTASREALRKALRPLERDMGVEINPVMVTQQEWANAASPFLDELRSRPIFELDLKARSVA